MADAADLLPVVYTELRRLAAARLAHEQPGQTLTATALVHEAYVRLTASQSPRVATRGLDATGGLFANRAHFFAAAAEAMRRILIERARRRKRVKHGGQRKRVEFDEAVSVSNDPPDDILAIDDALSRLEQSDARAAALVKLRYFAGLTMPEAADALGLSLRSAEREWTFARTWLHRALTDAESTDAPN